jgi:hypothetical protein
MLLEKEGRQTEAMVDAIASIDIDDCCLEFPDYPEGVKR